MSPMYQSLTTPKITSGFGSSAFSVPCSSIATPFPFVAFRTRIAHDHLSPLLFNCRFLHICHSFLRLACLRHLFGVQLSFYDFVRFSLPDNSPKTDSAAGQLSISPVSTVNSFP